MWCKLAALSALAVAFLVLMFWPISTDITVELPPPRSGTIQIDPDVAIKTIEIIAGVITFAIIAGILGLIGWLMWRVVRHHRALRNKQG